MAEVRVLLSEGSKRRFVERLKALLLSAAADPQSAQVPQQVHVIDVRTPSFLLQGGCLVQAKAVFPNASSVFWCLFFDGETDAILVPFLNQTIRMPDAIELVEQSRLSECVRIDSKTISDYVVEVMNDELTRFVHYGPWAGAGLLINDLDPNSRTFGVLDWPTPLLESERLEVNACLSTHSLRVHEDTDYSLRIEASILEHDALVWREFRIFTKDNSKNLYDAGKKGEIKPGKRIPHVLVKGLPDNCRAKPGASLGFTQNRFDADSEGWETIGPLDRYYILSDLKRRIKPLLDPTQLGPMGCQHLTFYDLDLLKIEPANSDGTSIAYILWRPGFALPLDNTSAPIHQLNMILAAERRLKLGDGRIVREPADAVDYLVFFARHTHGDEGPFVVLKGKDDTSIGQLDWTDAMIADRFDSVGAALAAIAAPAPRAMESSTGLRAFEVMAWVLYGNAIFAATFRVQADGYTEMTDDEPILSARVQGNPCPPYRRLESVSDPEHFKLLAAAELEKEPKPPTPIENCVLTGQLTLENLRVRNFRRCRFRGRVNLQLLVSEHGLSFEQCVFENGLDLSGASLKGKLSITQCLLVQGRHNLLIDKALPFSLKDLSADGLQIDELWSTGSLTANGVRIHGAVQLFKMTTLGEVDLTGLAAQSLHFKDTQAKGGIELSNCVIEQFMDFQNVRTTQGNVPTRHGSGIGLYGAVITHNYVAFEDISLAGDLSATFLRVGTGFFLESDAAPNKIGGSIELGGANIPKLLRIRDTHVGKSIEAKGVVTGEVRILGGRLSTTPEAPVEETAAAQNSTSNAPPATDAKRQFETSRIGGFIDLTDADIQHDVTMLDLDVGNDPGEDKDSNASLLLRNTKVGGNVRLFLTAKDGQALNWIHAEAKTEPDFSGQWQRGLDLKNAVILGDVDLSGVKCPAGKISLEYAEIHRDLHIRRRGSRHRTAATHLAMTGLKCQGAADITGLELPQDSPPTAESTNGAVIANLSTFAKKLVVSESLEASAKIPGRLDLSGCTIGELVLSVSSFEEKASNENLKIYGIILNQAQVNKFSAIKREHRYPHPIDLRFSEIKWWEFREGEKAESEESGDYIQLLKGDPNLQRHTFRSIEQNLFNRGHDDAADEVHKAMRKWLREQGKGKFDRCILNPARRFWDLLTNSTTSILRLVCIVAIWLAVSTGLFSNPANIGPSAEGLTTNREWRPNRVPPDAEWGAGAAFWMAVRFHVPVAVFTARNEWEPANGRNLTVFKYSWGWISPEDYANVVLAFHWIMWPIILIIASRKAFRRLDK